MAQETQANNRRIARNTIALYIRMFCSMVISLFTSRIILDSLGISNYGIYNVVGGFVAMFSIMSSSLTNSISRFLTFELGKGDTEKLKRVFSTSLNVMFALSIVVLLLIYDLNGEQKAYSTYISLARRSGDRFVFAVLTRIALDEMIHASLLRSLIADKNSIKRQ